MFYFIFKICRRKKKAAFIYKAQNKVRLVNYSAHFIISGHAGQTTVIKFTL